MKISDKIPSWKALLLLTKWPLCLGKKFVQFVAKCSHWPEKVNDIYSNFNWYINLFCTNNISAEIIIMFITVVLNLNSVIIEACLVVKIDTGFPLAWWCSSIDGSGFQILILKLANHSFFEDYAIQSSVSL